VVQNGKVTSIPLTTEREGLLHKHVDVDGSLVRAARLVGIELGEGPAVLHRVPGGPSHCATSERPRP
jgi:hypothetical protein